MGSDATNHRSEHVTPYEDCAVSVTTEWNDWRTAYARLGDLRDVHWHQPKGAPHALVHAYVSCLEIASGDLAHRCDALSAPHRLRVCVLKCRNIPTVYAELARRADENCGASTQILLQ
jgi:hypothetical protein